MDFPLQLIVFIVTESCISLALVTSTQVAQFVPSESAQEYFGEFGCTVWKQCCELGPDSAGDVNK